MPFVRMKIKTVSSVKVKRDDGKFEHVDIFEMAHLATKLGPEELVALLDEVEGELYEEVLSILNVKQRKTR